MFTKLLIINNKCGGGKDNSICEPHSRPISSLQAGKHVDALSQQVRSVRSMVDYAAKCIRLHHVASWISQAGIRLLPELFEKSSNDFGGDSSQMLTRGTLQRGMGSLVQPPLESCVNGLRRAPGNHPGDKYLAASPIPNPSPDYPATIPKCRVCHELGLGRERGRRLLRHSLRGAEALVRVARHLQSVAY